MHVTLFFMLCRIIYIQFTRHASTFSHFLWYLKKISEVFLNIGAITDTTGNNFQESPTILLTFRPSELRDIDSMINKPIFAKLVNNSPLFVEPKCCFPCTQQLTTGLHLQKYELSPVSRSQFLP